MPTFHIQLRAVMALAKASFKAMLHSPVSVVLSLLFPFIFIVVFGSMVDTRIVPLKIALEPSCDTANVIYRTLAETDNITIECFTKRKAAAIINIRKLWLHRLLLLSVITVKAFKWE